ncbi:MAG: leucine-rich repeat domain-containing protein, partial [Pseudomonas sp.]
MSCEVIERVKLDPGSISGLHGRFLAERLPEVLKHATADDLKRWRTLLRPAQLNAKGSDAWFSQASDDECQTLLDAQSLSRTSTQALAKALKDFQSPTAFAEPLLKAELKRSLGVDYDVNTAQIVEVHYESVLLDSMKQLRPVQQTLMQAAMQNYAAGKTFERGSALAPKGAFILELKPGKPGAYPQFQYRYCDKLSVTPERFANLCHELDLGKQYQQHISHIYENPATQRNVRTLSIAAEKDHVWQAAQTAFMKGEISDAGRKMIKGLVDGERAPLFHGKPVICHSLTMFSVALDQVVVLSADRLDSQQEEPIIVYLPGAPLYPLKEYASVAAFRNDLRINLLNPAYQKLFRGYVEHKEQPHFFKRLKEAVYDKYGQFDANANLYLRDVTIAGDLFDYLQDRHLLRLKANAREWLVPSAEVDEAANKLRLAYWENIGLNVLNAAAFFVPVLGAVMAVVAAVQLVSEIIDGVHAWQAGDIDEALAHFEAVALNVVVAVGLGAAGHLSASYGSTEAVDGLLRVTLPNGQERLWKPDLAPYARDVELSGIKPDEKGVYALDSKSYVRIGKQAFEVTRDGNEKWSIRHPDDPQAYQPALKHNGEGTWQAEGEQPLKWKHEQLLERLGSARDGLSDEKVEQAVNVSGVNDDVLRRMHTEQLPLPPLLKDTLYRYRVNRRVSRLIDSLSDGTVAADGLDLSPSLSQDLMRWPQRLIEVFDELSPDREPIRYGATRWPDGRVIRISLRQLYANQLAELILADLSEGEALEFFGSSVEADQRLPVLRRLIAERAVKRRAEIFKTLLEHGRAPRTAEQALLIRDFPKLSDAAAKEIIDTAAAGERQQLQDKDGRVPMRLAEEARVYQRQSVLCAAIQGLHEGSLASLDSDRLAVGLLTKLPGWSDSVRIELREDSLSGRLLASAGKADGELKIIVRNADGYVPYDAQGLELSRGEPLYASLLKALPDSERQALGLQIGAAQSLQTQLYATAVADRGAAASALGQQPIKPWFRPPMRLSDDRVGYTLGGAVGSMAIDAKFNALFPNLPLAELERLKTSLLQENQHLGDAVYKLQLELAKLEQTLEGWVAEGGDIFQRANRERTRRQLIRAWRRQGGRLSSHLTLEGGDIAPLPTLAARFDHIRILRLQHTGLQALPDGFLRCFPNVKHLSLEGNAISVLPPEIANLTQLRTLDLRGMGLDSSDTMFDALRPLARLQQLNLQSGGLESI